MTTTSETRFSFYWPPGRARTPRRSRSKFATTFTRARNAVLHELRLLGAEDVIMGHVDESMAGAYREHVEDERLKAVTDHVRSWLFPAEPAKSKQA